MKISNEGQIYTQITNIDVLLIKFCGCGDGREDRKTGKGNAYQAIDLFIFLGPISVAERKNCHKFSSELYLCGVPGIGLLKLSHLVSHSSLMQEFLLLMLSCKYITV